MSNGFEPGKPAMIINSWDPQVIGLGVELVAYIPPFEEYEMPDGTYYESDGIPSWHVKAQTKVLIELKDLNSLEEPYNILTDEFIVMQKNLMPLKGDNFEKEEEKDVLLSLSD